MRQEMFGRLAVHFKLITLDQLNHATEVQASEGSARRLGEVLVALGHLSPVNVERLLQFQRENPQYADREEDLKVAEASAPPRLPPAVERAAEAPRSRPPIQEDRHTLDLVVAQPHAIARPLVPTPPNALAKLHGLLGEASRLGASDLHIHSGAPIKMRLHGVMTAFGAALLSHDEAEAMLMAALLDEQRAMFEEHGEIDLAYTVEGKGRYRTNIFREHRGIDGVFHVVPAKPPTLAELRLPNELARLTTHSQGLILLTGPAGCGKSATMSALINVINEERADHILTIEDPIETLHPGKRSVVNQRQVGRHTGSFHRALRAALREDPDVIALGELRDFETISLALTAAETGHLVLATLHTNNAIRTIDRLIGVFPSSQQAQVRTMLSDSLRGIISQRLVPTAHRNGRVPALEILISTKAIANLVRENKSFQIRDVLQTGQAQGMCLLDASLAELVKSGVITREEAIRHADDPKRMGV